MWKDLHRKKDTICVVVMPSLAGMRSGTFLKLGQIAAIITYITSPPLTVWIANQNIARITLDTMGTVSYPQVSVSACLKNTSLEEDAVSTNRNFPKIPSSPSPARERAYDIARPQPHSG